ncbi:hypothetical protein [Dyella subtropica]|uniref:hypothetical protein n=1 Tax=Dyella subtropica TaxID=2992127 RepID=UPI00224E004C|nr:hypothetical protein [Dyella subtropica]
MNTHHPDDERLPGEDKLAALYRKLPKKEPGPALDAAVLRAAAQAVQPAAHRRTRWPIALGSAAVLVLAAGLGWRMRDMPLTQTPPSPGATTIEAERTSAEPASADRASPVQAAANVREAAAPVADQPVAAAAPAPSPTTPHLRAGQATVTAMKVQRYAPAAPSQIAPVAEALQAPVPAPPAAEQAATYASPMPLASGDAAKAESMAPQSRMMAAPRAMDQATPAPAPTMDNDTARDPNDTPAQELDKIRHLFSSTHRNEARQRLADFHRDHPDYPLPDDLRTQLLTP